MRRRSLIAVLSAALLGFAVQDAVAGGTDQTVTTRSFELRNGGSPNARRLRWKVRDRAGRTLVGDPTNGGGQVTMRVGSTAAYYPLFQGNWRPIHGGGFLYSNHRPGAITSAVRGVKVRQTPGGLDIDLVLYGRDGGLGFPQPGPGDDAALQLGLGNLYCGGTAGGAVVSADASLFSVKYAPAPADCEVIVLP
jgi:hypothetical protein